MTRAAITSFMLRTDLPVHGIILKYEPNRSIQQLIRKEIRKWKIETLLSSVQHEHLTSTGFYVSTTFYAHLHIDIQVQIALYTFLTCLIDDFDVGTQALEEFGTRLCSGHSQLHPILDCMAKLLGRMPTYFLPYASQSIVISTIQFINATAFDKKTASMSLSDSASSFVEYKRERSGLGEAYGFFAWDKFTFPDISTYVQVIPDVFSFYKEELAGERNNFVHDRATLSKSSLLDALFSIVDEILAAIKRARCVLKGEKERRIWNDFLAGYVLYHFIAPRYLLRELIEA
ncbi:hypothetical protein PHLCEN_2v3745 [Hermanssonia centrifuga]|uniref:Uncharacterized protein n=1 Tax=Hermanssonia centrifuga TaxID=98765 RepID=A0A2R6QBM8_9APHY|nr:hypothetical protein PHLCEN_2v3745 [Hermanssonia centrifuga]